MDLADEAGEQATAEETFGHRVRALREARKFTLADLANHLGITTGVSGAPINLDPSAVARLEKGQRSIRLNEAVAIAKVFDQTVDEMLRPALRPAEQIQQAERYVEHMRWRASWVLGEFQAAQARRDRLVGIWKDELGLGEEGGESPDVADDPGHDDALGEHRSPS